ncbi:hypothetical protein FA95DRAFT_1679474 [Auriscalpium vulgare]|uniref:Uncharacterized protein n=1 Tax=Auriscalpium vulgare TaxID=40419 RepID=A0ACB8RRT8_9AGAM|nr:hypothetical protein FA95DRAFT_1679474 [Auriscalpium vulgare]
MSSSDPPNGSTSHAELASVTALLSAVKIMNEEGERTKLTINNPRDGLTGDIIGLEALRYLLVRRSDEDVAALAQISNDSFNVSVVAVTPEKHSAKNSFLEGAVSEVSLEESYLKFTDSGEAESGWETSVASGTGTSLGRHFSTILAYVESLSRENPFSKMKARRAFREYIVFSTRERLLARVTAWWSDIWIADLVNAEMADLPKYFVDWKNAHNSNHLPLLIDDAKNLFKMLQKIKDDDLYKHLPSRAFAEKPTLEPLEDALRRVVQSTEGRPTVTNAYNEDTITAFHFLLLGAILSYRHFVINFDAKSLCDHARLLRILMSSSMLDTHLSVLENARMFHMLLTHNRHTFSLGLLERKYDNTEAYKAARFSSKGSSDNAGQRSFDAEVSEQFRAVAKGGTIIDQSFTLWIKLLIGHVTAIEEINHYLSGHKTQWKASLFIIRDNVPVTLDWRTTINGLQDTDLDTDLATLAVKAYLRCHAEFETAGNFPLINQLHEMEEGSERGHAVADVIDLKAWASVHPQLMWPALLSPAARTGKFGAALKTLAEHIVVVSDKRILAPQSPYPTCCSVCRELLKLLPQPDLPNSDQPKSSTLITLPAHIPWWIDGNSDVMKRLLEVHRLKLSQELNRLIWRFDLESLRNGGCALRNDTIELDY